MLRSGASLASHFGLDYALQAPQEAVRAGEKCARSSPRLTSSAESAFAPVAQAHGFSFSLSSRHQVAHQHAFGVVTAETRGQARNQNRLATRYRHVPPAGPRRLSEAKENPSEARVTPCLLISGFAVSQIGWETSTATPNNDKRTTTPEHYNDNPRQPRKLKAIARQSMNNFTAMHWTVGLCGR